MINIVHLEDLRSDAELVAYTLKKSSLQCNIIWVKTRQDFEKVLIESENTNVILSDHSLHQFTSLEAFQIYKDSRLKIPFILVTSTVSEEFAVNMMKEGVADYILKDRLQRLPGAILNALAKYNSEIEKEKYLLETTRQEKKFRALIENISDAILLLDKNGNIIYSSASTYRITGYDGDSLLNQNILELFDPIDLNQVRSVFIDALSQQGVAIKQIIKIKHKNGSSIWTESTITNFLNESSVEAIVVDFRDITEQKNASDLLRKSEAILLTIVNNAELAYVMIDRKFRVISYNSRAEDAYKKEFKQVLREGAYLFDYLPDNRKAVTKADFIKVIQGEKLRYETGFEQEDGTKTWYSMNVFPVYDELKQILGLIIATEDITHRKTAEIEKEKLTSELIQHNKNLEQFAYIISHNLRAPVANILGLANVLKNIPNMNENDFNRCLDGLSQSVKRLDDIIIDLNFILQKRRAIDEKKEIINFHDLISDIKNLINNTLEKNNVTIKTNFNSVSNIFTIKSYLTSIFLNLITNSIKYSRPEISSIIEITSRQTDKGVIIHFKDNGLGIDLKAHGDKIFGLYKKFHPHIEGKGMGLYMVKSQVELLGGKISIISQVNQGTTITLEFAQTPISNP